MNRKPEKLNDKTPQWFRDFYNREFWHLQIRVENQGKLIWIILTAVIVGLVARFFGFGG